MKRLVFGALLLLAGHSTAGADDSPGWFGFATTDPFVAEGESARSNSFLFFSGAFTTGSIGETWPWTSPDYSDHYFLGGAYARDVFDLPLGFMLGGELGGSVRFGDGDNPSGEIWSGIRLRHHGLVIGSLNIAPAFTVGLSAVSDTLPIEAERERANNGDATLLGYVGPELSLRFRQMPNLEFVYRLHHRSGADGRIGNMHEGSNANSLGIRVRF